MLVQTWLHYFVMSFRDHQVLPFFFENIDDVSAGLTVGGPL